MLWSLSLIFALAWLAGLVNDYTLDGAIHVLLVLAIIALALELISKRHSAI